MVRAQETNAILTPIEPCGAGNVKPYAASRESPSHWSGRFRSFALNSPRQDPSMPQSMSQASLPVFEINLNALSGVLDKAEAFAKAKKIDPAVLLHSRLSPDMFDLTRQVQVATDGARLGAARRHRGAESRGQ
jgi:hypothetical protein